MKRLITILLFFLVYVNLFGQHTPPMVVAGKMQVDGPVYSGGVVHVFASVNDCDTGKIDIAKNAELKTDTIILYSNNMNDGLLRNMNETGGITQLTKNEPPKAVIVRKTLSSKKWTYMSLPFNVPSENIKDDEGDLIFQTVYNFPLCSFAKFDPEKRAVLSSRESKDVWVSCDDEVETGGLKKGIGYQVYNRYNISLPIDFILDVGDSIEKLLNYHDKAITYPVWIAPANIWKNPEYGEGWAFIGGLNTANFQMKDYVSYGGAAFYRLKKTGTTPPSSLISESEFTTALRLDDWGGDSTTISPYTPFYIQASIPKTQERSPLKASSVDSSFIFKKEGLLLSKSFVNFRSANEDMKDLLYFALSSDRNNAYDRFYLTFADHYSETYTTSEDAITMTTFFEDSPAVWCLDGANSALALNGLPMKGERKVEMGFSVPEAGDYTFRLDPRKLTDVRTVNLVDSVAGKRIDLLQHPNYSFTTSDSVKNKNDRFVLYINSDFTDIPLVDTDKPYAYVKDNILTVKNLLQDDMVSVYDLSGRMLVSGKASGTEFSTVLRQKGVYVVNVKMKSGQTSVHKVLNK